MTCDNIIEMRGLKTHFNVDEGLVRSVDGVDLAVPRGKVLCIVGESGSGKSVLARSLMHIIPSPGRIVEGSIHYRPASGDTIDITALDPFGTTMRNIRGTEFGMVFQEPMTALSPVHTIGDQVTEALILHRGISRKAADERAMGMLARVGLADPRDCLKRYPFELSGGMRQRVCIAMALIGQPQLLIADEPTTALDVTTQAQVLDLIRDLQEEMAITVIFITHNLGVVAEIADHVAVMYLGRVVEFADVDRLFHAPAHPYTKALLQSIPRRGFRGSRLPAIRGNVPHPLARPAGCPFQTRCDHVLPGLCDTAMPEPRSLAPDHEVSCLRVEPARAGRQLERAE